MSDDFDLRLRTALGALAAAVPVEAAGRPTPAAGVGRPVSRDGSQPVVARVHARHGLSAGWSAAAVGLIIVIVAAAALLGGGRNGQPGASTTPVASPTGSLPSTAGPERTSLPGLTTIQPDPLLGFGADGLTGLVLGPDGAAYVLDSSLNVVYAVNLNTGAKIAVISAGEQPTSGGPTVGHPRLLTTGGDDVLVLDSNNLVWRWHPGPDNTFGVGSMLPVYIPDSVNWGAGVRAMSTRVVNEAQNLYDLYVVVPSLKQILKYPAAPDGSGYATNTRSNFLMDARDLDTVDDMYVDGNVYVVQGGKITKYDLGQAVRAWSPADPGGPVPYYTRLVGDSSTQDRGIFYAYDQANGRIVAFAKADGAFVGQYMVPTGTPWLSGLTGMFVAGGVGGANPTLYWVANMPQAGTLMSASLSSAVTPSPSESGSSSASLVPTTPVPSLAMSTGTPAAVSSNPGQWIEVTASMTTDGGGRATLLADGRVLILDGTSGRAELYDPKSGKFSLTGSTRTDSPAETATLLHDGRVLVTGFSVRVTVTDGWYDAPLLSAEIYNPSTKTFSATGSMTTARFGATATLLQDGRVLIAGGSDGRDSFTSAELYDPATGKFGPTGSMLNPRFGHAATLLQDGRVLITGGVDSGSATLVAELYDPKAGTFSATGSMIFAAASQTATLLRDGRVLIAGGGDEGDPITERAELYDPKSGTFSSTGSMSTAREIFTATLLADGRVLVGGGLDGSGGTFASAELFDPATGRFTSAASMSGDRYGQSAILLRDGHVLVTGGGPVLAELYQP